MLAVKDGGIFIVNIILHSGVIDEGLRANLDMKKHSKRKGDGGNEPKPKRVKVPKQPRPDGSLDQQLEEDDWMDVDTEVHGKPKDALGNDIEPTGKNATNVGKIMLIVIGTTPSYAKVLRLGTNTKAKPADKAKWANDEKVIFASIKKPKTLENFTGLYELIKKNTMNGLTAGTSYYVLTYDKVAAAKIGITILKNQEVNGALVTAENFGAQLKRKPAVNRPWTIEIPSLPLAKELKEGLTAYFKERQETAEQVEALVKEAKGLYDGKVFLGRILLQSGCEAAVGPEGHPHRGGSKVYNCGRAEVPHTQDCLSQPAPLHRAIGPVINLVP